MLVLYAFFLTFILVYSFVQFNLVLEYRKSRKKEAEVQRYEAPELAEEDLPMVTVQLPIYNELYVVERVIESIAQFNYPRDKFEIQVLDDSNDETVELIANKVKEVKARGINIEHIQREDRKGYKAGALAYGMTVSKGSLSPFLTPILFQFLIS